MDYDPKELQKTDFVRVKINLNVANPARISKNLTLPGGEIVEILYEYEKLRKRCFYCQRFTHEQASCQWMKKAKDVTREENKIGELKSSEMRLRCSLVGRGNSPKMLEAPPGLLPMFPGLSREDNRMAMQYISHADPTERNARILRVQQSLEEDTSESMAQTMRITINVDKGKVKVYQVEEEDGRKKRIVTHADKPVISAPVMNMNNLYEVEVTSAQSWNPSMNDTSSMVSRAEAETGIELGDSSLRGKKERKWPPAWKRRTRHMTGTGGQQAQTKQPSSGKEKEKEGVKRKGEEEGSLATNKTPRILENMVASALKPLPSK
ncbi:hypothetical protein V5N11_002774 [Cardamine amara subsp. amara]|uniref:Zinc knuckle CX2CX4HX4C domain-containing protein n=1 Tax=Cardamine amara subsp. amara TaxID=228776 RepID=A0ABD1C6D2_CARAN